MTILLLMRDMKRRSVSRQQAIFLISSLGVCYGMQLAVIEFARNILGWKGKNPLTVIIQERKWMTMSKLL